MGDDGKTTVVVTEVGESPEITRDVILASIAELESLKDEEEIINEIYEISEDIAAEVEAGNVDRVLAGVRLIKDGGKRKYARQLFMHATGLALDANCNLIEQGDFYKYAADVQPAIDWKFDPIKYPGKGEPRKNIGEKAKNRIGQREEQGWSAAATEEKLVRLPKDRFTPCPDEGQIPTEGEMWVNEDLLARLEALLTAVESSGRTISGKISVISGYRVAGTTAGEKDTPLEDPDGVTDLSDSHGHYTGKSIDMQTRKWRLEGGVSEKLKNLLLTDEGDLIETEDKEEKSKINELDKVAMGVPAESRLFRPRKKQDPCHWSFWESSFSTKARELGEKRGTGDYVVW